MNMRQTHLTNRDLKHPVDFIEKIANGHNWLFERIAQDEITILVAGQTDYDVSFSWLHDRETLHIACSFKLAAADYRSAEVLKLIAQINLRLVIGHFDYWPASDTVIYRQALLLSGGLSPSDAQIELLLANSLETCEGHYQAFHLVCSSAADAATALKYALFETRGNA